MKRIEKPTANMTFIALMSAINGILALLNSFVPILSFFLILLLPLTTTLVVLACKARYYAVYYIASALICYFVSFEGPEAIIFTLVPSLLTGTIFGLLIKQKVPASLLALISTCAYSLFSLATLPVIKAIYDVDMFVVYQELLKIKSLETAKMTFLPFIYALSLTQISFTLFIIANELKKLKVRYPLDISHTLVMSLTTIISFLLSLSMCFIAPSLIYLFMAITITSGLIVIVYYVSKKSKFVIGFLLANLLITFFLFAILFSVLDHKYLCLLLTICPLSFAILDILLNIIKKYLLLRVNSAKIKEEVK